MKIIILIWMMIISIIPFSQIKISANEGFIIENGALLSYEGNAQEIVIPEEVTTIQERAFYHNENITKVIMHDQVQVIEKEAFAHCYNLEEIQLSSQLVHMGADVFIHTSHLTSLLIPSSLQFVDYSDLGVFYGSGLQKVWMSEGMIELPYYLFKNAWMLKEVHLPNSLQKIQDGAFYRCSMLQIIDFPSQLTYLGDHAFYRCERLANVQLPSQLEYMGADVFQGCTAITKIHIPKSIQRVALTSDGIFYETNLQEVSFEEGTTIIPQYLCKGAEKLKTIVFPSTLLQINDGAFYGCDAIEEVYLPKTLQHLRRHAFASCKGLKVVYGLDSLTYFDEKAFSNSPQICLYIKEGSLAHQVAINKGWDYVLIKDMEVLNNVCLETMNETSVKLSWDEVEATTQYYISYYEEDDNKQQIYYTHEPQFIIDDLNENTNYIFQVGTYLNYDSLELYSDAVYIQHKNYLEPIEITSIQQASSSALRISWEESKDTNTYELYRATNRDGTYHFIGTYDKTSVIVSGQQTGKTYYYKVRSVQIESPYLKSTFSNIKDGSSQLQSNQLQYKDGKLIWNAISGASYYQIYRAQGYGSKFQKYITLSKNKRSYPITSSKQTTYYKIRGYKRYSSGNVYSPFSNIVKIVKE